MRVVQILPELNEGGVERGSVELAGELVVLGYDAIIISNGGKMVDTLQNSAIKHIKFDVFHKNLLTFFQRVFGLRQLLKELKPDIVHVRSRLPAWLLYFAKFGLNFKVVSTIHGLNSVNFYSKIMTSADKIICVSNCVKEYALRNFNAPKDKLIVIHRGVDVKNFDPTKLASKSELRAEFGYDDNDFIVSCIGRITHIKSIETLIKAGKILASSVQNLKILIVGSVHPKRQSYFDSLKSLVLELGLEKNVIFAGSTSQIAKIYKLSDVSVSASIKPESFGRVMAESIALNTPVVATNHGGAKEIVLNGVNGYLFEPRNERELAEKILLARDLNFDGFGYIAANFTLEKMSRETIKVYREIINA